MTAREGKLPVKPQFIVQILIYRAVWKAQTLASLWRGRWIFPCIHTWKKTEGEIDFKVTFDKLLSLSQLRWQLPRQREPRVSIKLQLPDKSQFINTNIVKIFSKKCNSFLKIKKTQSKAQCQTLRLILFVCGISNKKSTPCSVPPDGSRSELNLPRSSHASTERPFVKFANRIPCDKPHGAVSN